MLTSLPWNCDWFSKIHPKSCATAPAYSALVCILRHEGKDITHINPKELSSPAPKLELENRKLSEIKDKNSKDHIVKQNLLNCCSLHKQVWRNNRKWISYFKPSQSKFPEEMCKIRTIEQNQRVKVTQRGRGLFKEPSWLFFSPLSLALSCSLSLSSPHYTHSPWDTLWFSLGEQLSSRSVRTVRKKQPRGEYKHSCLSIILCTMCCQIWTTGQRAGLSCYCFSVSQPFLICAKT